MSLTFRATLLALVLATPTADFAQNTQTFEPADSSQLVDLVQWLWQEHRISVCRQTLGRELQALGYRKLTARPKHHAQDPQAIEDYKKVSPPQWQRLPPEQPEENE